MPTDTMPDLNIRTLGEATLPSPIPDVAPSNAEMPRFTSEHERILLDDRLCTLRSAANPEDLPSLELAGPREKVYFDAATTKIGIVTCGGLCPGLNDVIRGIVMEAWFRYGVRKVYGFRYGYQGFIPRYGHKVLELDPEMVSEIHEDGGSFLSSSRGEQSTSEIVDTLQQMEINILFVIGGDGTMRGGLDISQEIHRRGASIAVIGVPKTIDNDLAYVDQSFGFETAYTEAVNAIVCAHNESKGTLNGVGLVKVMGRHSGFIACNATLATSHVNFCLIPEMPIRQSSGRAFFDALAKRLQRRRHAVIVVAEGFGQDLVPKEVRESDASGNVKLIDVGTLMVDLIKSNLNRTRMEFSLKYIDPSYIIRSVPAEPPDAVYCWQLAQNAVHAAMAGKTEMVVGRWHGRLVHVPIAAAISHRNVVDLQGDLWLSVLETTGQPAVFD